MRRDWDLIRALLKATEELPDANSAVHPGDIDGWDGVLVAHHISILGDAGLIHVKCRCGGAGRDCFAFGLTWRGHELLDGIGDRSVWNRIKRSSCEHGITLTLDTVSILVKQILTEMLA